MNQTSIKLNGKTVKLSEPFEMDQEKSSRFIGRDEIMEVITASWMGGPKSLPLSPLLVGPPGVGKNRLVYELAKRKGQNLYIFQGHEDVTAEDLACLVRFSDSNERKLDYILSPVSTALCKGGILFIDEIAKIRPRALSILVSVLDERRYIDSNLLGDRIKAHEDFRFIAATNNADLVNRSLPDFIASRLRPVILVGYQAPEEINMIIKQTYNNILEQNMNSVINAFWIEWNKHISENKMEKEKTPSPREVIYVINLAISFSKIRKGKKVTARDVETSCKKIFKTFQNEKFQYGI